ncbi:MAG: tetrahydromethanopterin S-methyltransferase subunit A [Thermoplasmata archaeon]|nr:tetrahydromethanopterin S-methyltransferase subunit A [Thermoplasmata archaeon]
MNEYLWGGEFNTGNYESPVAVVTMAERIDLPEGKVAVWGKMMTENLGVEKVVANIISNPNIRFLIIFGSDIRGHRSGSTLLSLHENGLGEDNRILGAPGAMPYIENIDREAVERFQQQVEIVNLLGEEKEEGLLKAIDDCIEKDPGSFGDPYIAIKIETKGAQMEDLQGKIALCRDLLLDPLGKITTLNTQGEE